MGLQGSTIIDEQKIWRCIPNNMILGSTLRIMINESKPVWVLTLESGEQWYYVLFSHEIVQAENIHFGKIYIGRTARWLRDEYEHKGNLKKLYSVFFCTSKTMFLVKESKEYWPQGLEDHPDPKIRDLAGGYFTKTKWFAPFPSSEEAEEVNKNEPY